MKYLLDTHAFLWYVLDDPMLSETSRNTIAEANADVFISPASYWEIAIKTSLGKYELKTGFANFWQRGLQDNDFRILPIEIRHASNLISLPFHHKDPFDRLIVAQAMAENLPLISADREFDAYPVKRIW